MLSPSLSRITKRMRSSITELSFHGIHFPPPSGGKSVTHVSGTFCYLCLGTVTITCGVSEKRGLQSSPRLRPFARSGAPFSQRPGIEQSMTARVSRVPGLCQSAYLERPAVLRAPIASIEARSEHEPGYRRLQLLSDGGVNIRPRRAFSVR